MGRTHRCIAQKQDAHPEGHDARQCQPTRPSSSAGDGLVSAVSIGVGRVCGRLLEGFAEDRDDGLAMAGIELLDLTGVEPRQITPMMDDEIELTWSPDGARLDVQTKQRLSLLELDGWAFRQSTFSGVSGFETPSSSLIVANPNPRARSPSRIGPRASASSESEPTCMM